MNPNLRNFALWVIIVLLVVALVMLFQKPGQRAPTQEITFSQLLTEADPGHIKRCDHRRQSEITGHYHRWQSRLLDLCAERSRLWCSTLYKKNVQITAQAAVRRQ